MDKDGNRRITFDEAYEQIPEDYRSPELEHQCREQFKEMDTNKSGDIDMDEFIAYWRKAVEPLLEAYEQQMSSYAAEYGSYQVSYGESNWDSSYAGNQYSSYGGSGD
jgi:Ca2+-binding EF-hand superfamily protein